MTNCSVCAGIGTERVEARANGTLTLIRMTDLGQRIARHAADCPDPATAEAVDQAVGRRFGTAGAWAR